MAFVALVGTLRRVMPQEAASELAKLYELTSVKKDYKPEDYHREAFDKCKKHLTQEPLFVKLPDVTKVKILFSDSSSNIIGGILAQVQLETTIDKRTDDLKPHTTEFSKFDPMGKFLLSKHTGVSFHSVSYTHLTLPTILLV